MTVRQRLVKTVGGLLWLIVGGVVLLIAAVAVIAAYGASEGPRGVESFVAFWVLVAALVVAGGCCARLGRRSACATPGGTRCCGSS